MSRLLSWGWNLIALWRAARRPSRWHRRTLLRLEVLDERIAPAGGVLENYAVTQDWGSGFQAQLQLVNQQAAALNNWQVQFNYGAAITSIWNAHVVSHSGSQYVIQGDSWDKDLPAGGSVSFGFNASPGGPQATTSPTNYVVTGGTSVQPPTLAIANTSVTAKTSGTTNALFPVTLSAASAAPVTVHYATTDGTAKAGANYQAASGTLTFAPGQTRQTISVPVAPESKPGPDLTFSVQLSGPSGATLGTSRAVATIHDPVPPPPSGNVQFRVVSDWGSGYTGQVTLKNSGAAALNNWTLGFTYGGQISSIWNAAIVSHTGNQYVVRNADWNSSIPAGGTASFGFVASPGSAAGVPANFVLTGSGGGSGGGGGGNQNPVANNDVAWTRPGQSATINVLANDTDPAGHALAVASFTQGRYGTVTENRDGTLTYAPKAGFTGSDAFTYKVSDGLGGSATATVSVNVSNPSPSAWPSQFYAPYVDMTLYPMYNLTTAMQQGGVKDFTLAFVVADPSGRPSWGGYPEYDVNGGTFDTQLKQQIAAVRGLGGDVMVSFGGASGQELAQANTNVATLTAAYQSVINAYGLTHIDFDIEGAAVADPASIDRRSQAIAALEKNAAAQGKDLQVWFTLPVLPTGLTSDGLYVLQSAQKYGVHVAGVNLMTMDYGDGAAPNPKGQMGTYAIDAAKSVHAQLQTLYGSTKTSAQFWQMIGLTPMIGLNDVTTEVFDQQAAEQVAAFALQTGIGRISMWSLNRDRQDPQGAIGYVEPTSSSLVQNPYDFSTIVETFVR